MPKVWRIVYRLALLIPVSLSACLNPFLISLNLPPVRQLTNRYSFPRYGCRIRATPDPSAGRFLTRDPIGYKGGINLYSYVENSPVNFVDPLG
jgi:RHS repeat-associated protein